MDELSISYIYSPVYSPDYNPIEYVFGMAKSIVKMKRLKAIVDEEEIDLYSEIEKSFYQIDRLKIAHCV